MARSSSSRSLLAVARARELRSRATPSEERSGCYSAAGRSESRFAGRWSLPDSSLTSSRYPRGSSWKWTAAITRGGGRRMRTGTASSRAQATGCFGFRLRWCLLSRRPRSLSCGRRCARGEPQTNPSLAPSPSATLGRRQRAHVVAEREGFEPSVRLPVHLISSQAPSATRSPLQVGRALGPGEGTNRGCLGQALRREWDSNPRYPCGYA